ncbi:MAG: hypothetical protein R6U20_02045 [Longimonas sp.]|uniref:hypothetical protein n=1 Tax=Longimonas sp. TaxID=2039626 RepID=UPI003975D8B1
MLDSSFARWTGGILLGCVLVGVVLVQTVPFVGMAWGALTGGPGLGLIRDVRTTLLEQEAFRETLVAHEREALRRYRTSGTTAHQQRHLIDVDLAPMGMPTFWDVWGVRVRTDIVDGVPRTAFLARPGVILEENDAVFFAKQCDGALCKQGVRLAGYARDVGVSWGVLTTYRLNITESDATSRVTLGASPMPTAEWAEASRERHHNGDGRRFTSAKE